MTGLRNLRSNQIQSDLTICSIRESFAQLLREAFDQTGSNAGIEKCVCIPEKHHD